MTRSVKVALVGSYMQENLACGYLSAVVEQAGHEAYFIQFDGRHHFSSCLQKVLEFEPDLVGLSIPFQGAFVPSLELAEHLRSTGYKGHVTCGGHVPTFSAREMLDDCPAIDTAVRHEGEETLLEIIDLISAGKPVIDLKGLVWRGELGVVVGEPRAPVEDLDTLPFPKKQGKPFVTSGVPVSFLVGSRGCIGNCAYCSIRAFSRDMGGSRIRFRSVESVADEIAQVHHRTRARIFYLLDDLFFLPNRDKAVKRMQSLSQELKALGVEEVAFCVKARPEAIDDVIVQAAVEMGVIHVFLGIENASKERLEYLGRVHTPDQNVSALKAIQKRGLRASFNILVFDPDATVEDISKNIEFAAKMEKTPWSIGRTEIYSGTRLLERLKSEGRLVGNYRAWDYRMKDIRAEIMYRIVRVAFKERTLDMGSLHNQVTNLSFAGQIHTTFFPGSVTSDLTQEIDTLMQEVYSDTVSRLRQILDFSTTVSPDDHAAIKDFAVKITLDMNQNALPWRTRISQLLAHLNSRGETLFRHT